jgi:hypothetical protein
MQAEAVQAEHDEAPTKESSQALGRAESACPAGQRAHVTAPGGASVYLWANR